MKSQDMPMLVKVFAVTLFSACLAWKGWYWFGGVPDPKANSLVHEWDSSTRDSTLSPGMIIFFQIFKKSVPSRFRTFNDSNKTMRPRFGLIQRLRRDSERCFRQLVLTQKKLCRSTFGKFRRIFRRSDEELMFHQCHFFVVDDRRKNFAQ